MMRGLPLTTVFISSLCTVSTFASDAANLTDIASVNWVNCARGVPASVECGEIRVPLNHADPYGDTVVLAFTRLRSTGNCNASLGLYIENGGPGEPNSNVAVDVALGESTRSYAELRPFFDIIGLDMRGTGDSVPVRCDPSTWNRVTYPMVEDEASFEDMFARSQAWGQSCVNMTGPLINHMGTDQAVKDLELLRQALGHEKLNYLGFSYGTELGSEYAEMYPDKVGRMVLDGVYDRHLSDELFMVTTAVGQESTLDDFFRWCNTTTNCTLYGRDQAAIFDAVVAAAENGTLRAQQCVGGPCRHDGTAKVWELMQSTLVELHDYNDRAFQFNWYAYAEGLKAAFDDGNGTYFVTAQTTAESSSLNFVDYSQFAILCSDRPRRRLQPKDFRNVYTLTAILAPHTRGYGTTQMTLSVCSGWPISASNPPHELDPLRMAKLPPIMLVNAFYDPSTVSPWGLDMRKQIPTAFSVYRRGGGHTSWSHNGDTTKAINAFLIQGAIPLDGTIYDT